MLLEAAAAEFYRYCRHWYKYEGGFKIMFFLIMQGIDKVVNDGYHVLYLQFIPYTNLYISYNT